MLFQHLVAIPGSIPACAGEPIPGGDIEPLAGVYPRVCGGTPNSISVNTRGKGLSPRVRGNRYPARIGPGYHRSIPACAGEPDAAAAYSAPSMVYPRVCGGIRRR